MRQLFFVACCLLWVTGVFGQTVGQKLQKAFAQFEADPQLKHAISSLYVIDAKTGKVVFDKNSQVGLAPASTQKIITAATAFELLGKGYRYKTEFGRCIDIDKDIYIWINPSGDPTFGSWRWESTQEKNLLNAIVNGLKGADFNRCKGVIINEIGWNAEQIPDGWIWQDIGNYYGAGAGILNWRENQFDLFLKSGNEIGDRVMIAGVMPVLYSDKINCEVTSAAKGSGDNAYIYMPSHYRNAVVRGTIPINEERFKISGSLMNPANEFLTVFKDSLEYKYNWKGSEGRDMITYGGVLHSPRIYYTHFSPPLDSIIYWFLQKSINLYGEALIKTFASQSRKLKSLGDTNIVVGATDSGVAVLKRFWKQKGIDEDELNLYDGSGLSPLNRVTTHAQVEVLKYAKARDWFSYFFNSLPEYNGMKMKSGTISDVKGFCGYHKAKDGKEYIFSFLVNNYNGTSSGAVNKMYKVLDLLK
ncbi:MAG: D-alanyl-D-alanine carboxypeptidase/D-alanyl-D-alanine-endopeptidase [Chitinophagaceae bacterium]|nr:D-alanyl-D-alanine carboxypeptidase/D-alanyl-D-alanine-endopeptidase [Chitinophagaceae bacterium]